MNVSRETLSLPEDQLLVESASALNIRLSDDQAARLIEFLIELRRWNERINLIGPAKPEEQVILHLVDSLAPLKFLPESPQTVLDLGSGAGLPGLVLAILRPGWQITMAEARAKKVDFIRHALRKFEIKNARVEQIRLEKGRDSFSGERFDLATFRALGHLKEVLPLVAPCIGPSGKILAYKGPEGPAEWQESKKVARKLGLNLEKTEEIALPVLGHRRVLLFIQTAG